MILAIYLTTLAVASPSLASSAEPSSQIYALVVANNHSLEPKLDDLTYTDDDGIKYLELFEAMGAEVEFFSLVDVESQQQFPRAAQMSQVPNKAMVLAGAERLFEAMRRDQEQGIETEFYFVFSGHGSLGPDQEGYIHLFDDRFRRSEFFHDLLGQSPADWNHIILDACQSYFFVQNPEAEPGTAASYQALLNREQLSAYPNTGVILAATSEYETQEWSGWRAGVFSHELRSGFLGAADANHDRRVSYSEATAFVEAANEGAWNPGARLHVYVFPPAGRLDHPLVYLDRIQPEQELHVESELIGRYVVEDARGQRVVDFHSSGETDLTLALVGQRPFFLKNLELEQEAEFPMGLDYAELSELNFRAAAF